MDPKLEKFRAVKAALEDERKIYIESISMCFDLMEKAYERTFKIQFQTCTFALVGIFTLYSWGKLEFFTACVFPVGKLWLYGTVILHAASLFLLTILNNRSAKLQTYKQELHKHEYTQRTALLAHKNEKADANTVILSLEQTDVDAIEKSLKPIINEIERLSRQANRCFNASNIVFCASIISTLAYVLASLRVE